MRFEALAILPVELQRFFRRIVAGRWHRHSELCDAFRVEPELDRLDFEEAANQETRAQQQRDREPDLSRQEQGSPQTAPGAGIPTATLPDHVCQRNACDL